MAEHNNRSFATLWPFLIPTALLTALLVYIAIPGNLLKRLPDPELAKLDAEQRRLQIELAQLKDSSERAVCVGDHLVVPQDEPITPLPADERDKPEESGSFLDKLERSVVLIIVQFKVGQPQMGSGFFISPSTIMTNGHVVTNEAKKPIEGIMVLNADVGMHKATLRKIDFNENSSTDFALLSIDGNAKGSPLKFANISDPSKEKLKDVFAAGFPGDVIESDGDFLKLMNSDSFSVPDLVVTDGKINSHQNIFGNAEAFFHTAQISQGNSGGPLVNSCGEVMGINTWITKNEGNSRNISLTTSGIEGFLVSSNVKPLVSAVECTDGE